jgi:hypothetical protein
MTQRCVRVGRAMPKLSTAGPDSKKLTSGYHDDLTALSVEEIDLPPGPAKGGSGSNENFPN